MAGMVDGWITSEGKLNVSDLPTVSAVKKGDTATVVIFFANCISAHEGQCNLRTDFTVSSPDGTEYGSYTNRILWSGRAPPRDTVRLGIPYMEFTADPKDAAGSYQFTARISAPGSDQTLVLQRKLAVEEAD